MSLEELKAERDKYNYLLEEYEGMEAQLKIWKAETEEYFHSRGREVPVYKPRKIVLTGSGVDDPDDE